MLHISAVFYIICCVLEACKAKEVISDTKSEAEDLILKAKAQKLTINPNVTGQWIAIYCENIQMDYSSDV